MDINIIKDSEVAAEKEIELTNTIPAVTEMVDKGSTREVVEKLRADQKEHEANKASPLDTLARDAVYDEQARAAIASEDAEIAKDEQLIQDIEVQTGYVEPEPTPVQRIIHE